MSTDAGVDGAPFPTASGADGAVDGVAFDGDGPVDGVASRLRPDRGFGGGALTWICGSLPISFRSFAASPCGAAVWAAPGPVVNITTAASADVETRKERNMEIRPRM